MKRKLLPFVLAGAMTAAFAAPVAAQDPCDISQVEETTRGGNAALAALIAAVVDANLNVAVCTVDVDVLNNSLNNLLRNANIEILNNSLNNILRNADVDIRVVDLDDTQIVVNVLSGGVVIDTIEINFVP